MTKPQKTKKPKSLSRLRKVTKSGAADADRSATLGQFQKFKEAAREVETDDSEERFDRTLKEIAEVEKHKQKQVS